MECDPNVVEAAWGFGSLGLCSEVRCWQGLVAAVRSVVRVTSSLVAAWMGTASSMVGINSQEPSRMARTALRQSCSIPETGLRCFLDVAKRHAVRCRLGVGVLTSRTSLPFSLRMSSSTRFLQAALQNLRGAVPVIPISVMANGMVGWIGNGCVANFVECETFTRIFHTANHHVTSPQIRDLDIGGDRTALRARWRSTTFHEEQPLHCLFLARADLRFR